MYKNITRMNNMSQEQNCRFYRLCVPEGNSIIMVVDESTGKHLFKASIIKPVYLSNQSYIFDA